MSPQKLKIGIDIDNVVSDSYKAFLEKFNTVFGTKIIYEKIDDFYYLEKSSGVDFSETREFINRLIIDETFQMTISPVTDAVSSIKKFHQKGHSIYFITARPKTALNHTKKWLAKHGLAGKNFILDLFEGTRHHLANLSQTISYKKRIVKEKGIDVLIEDSLEISEVMDIPVILIDRPWNRGVTGKRNLFRVKTWKEIESLFGNRFLL